MLAHYLSTALRNFRRNPLSTAIKLLALSLGLVCLLTAHAIGDYFRQVDRGWSNADRIHIIAQQTRRPGGGWESDGQGAGPAAARYLRADFPQLETVGRMFMAMNTMGRPGSDTVISTQHADPEFLDIFDLDMVAGAASLDRPRTVLIGEQAALSLFGNEDPIGQNVIVRTGLPGTPAIDATITGVFRDFPQVSHFSFGPGGMYRLEAITSIDTWRDLYVENFPGQPLWWETDDFTSTNFATYALLPEDGSLTAAELNAALDDFAARRVPPGTLEVRFRALPLTELAEARFNDSIGLPPGLSIVTGLYLLGGLTVAMGCINFANLAAAGATTRAREIGLRKTLGATRRQIAAQMLVETLMLVGAALLIVSPLTGLIASAISSRFDFTVSTPSLSRLDYWGGVATLAVFVVLISGLWPALALARLRPVFAMRMTGLGGGSGVARTMLIGVQFAAASLLAILVVVMLAQSASLRQTALRPGEDPVVTMITPDLPISITNVTEVQEGQLETIRQALLANPAITGVTFLATSPFETNRFMPSEFSFSLDPGARRFAGHARRVHYAHFETMGVRILAGRVFERGADNARKAVINIDTAAEMGFTPEQAIGQPIYRTGSREPTAPDQGGTPTERIIIGVVEREPLELIDGGVPNYIYVAQPTIMYYALVRLSQDNIAGGLEHVRRVWAQYDPSAAAADPVFLDGFFDQTYRAFRMITFVVIALAAIAAAIAAMGLFGMASFVVQRRLREIGVRKTLGASGPRVLALMLWDFSKPVIVANLIAWPVAFVAVRAYLNLFVTRIDLTIWPFLGALAASLLIAWIAVAAHVLRAASVQPSLVLRTE